MGLRDLLRLTPRREASRSAGGNSRPRRMRFPALRNFQAGDTGRLVSAWTTTPQTADAEIYSSLQKMRARSRAAARDRDEAVGFLGLVKKHVIGPGGIMLQAQVKDSDGTPDDLANKTIEDAWAEWGAGKECDIERQQDWVSIQQMVARTVAKDGEVLVHEHYGSECGPYGYAVQVIDPELLDVHLNQENLPGGGKIRMGIQFDRLNRPTAYHLLEAAEGVTSLQSGYMQLGGRHRVVPASSIIHLYLKDDPGQSRGVPWMHSALWRLNMLGAFQDAAVVASRAGAQKLGVITTPDGQSHNHDDEEEDGTPIEEMEAGIYQYLREGEQFDPYDPTYPHALYKDFVKTVLRGISTGLQVSYNALANDLEGVNFSSIRQGVLDERDTWRILQGWLAMSLNHRIYGNWVRMALLAGKLQVPRRGGGMADLRITDLDRYRKANWQARAWPWVDPLKDIQARKEEVALGVNTVSRIIREKGLEPREVFLERKAELIQMAELGILPVPPQASSAADLAALNRPEEV